MKKIFALALLALFVHPGIDAQENYLTASDSMNTSLPIEGSYAAFEVIGDSMFAIDGKTMYMVDLEQDQSIEYSTLEDEAYTGFPSFITSSPDKLNIWVGFTTADNSDDRIYNFDSFEKTWMHIATFPANFDMAYWKDQVLVSGLNSISWSDPNGIWLLDQSGNNDHRLLIATGGYSAGLDIDSDGNVYYTTSLFSDNAVLKWEVADVEAVLESSDDTLKIGDAVVLASLPAGAYDTDLDMHGNVIFNCNTFVENFIGTISGSSFDTLATSNSFLTKLSTWSGIEDPDPSNKVYAIAYGSQVAEIHHDIKPGVAQALPDMTIYTDETEIGSYDLHDVFHDEDDHDTMFVFSLLENSNPDIVYCEIDEHYLYLQHADAEPGYAELIVEAVSRVYAARDTIGVSVSFPVGIANPDPADAIVVYPNPATEYLKIGAGDIENGMISIIDMSGRTVLQQSYGHSDEAINIAGLKPGAYHLLLHNDGKQYSIRILKR